MPRGKRWTENQNKLLREMAAKGMNVKQIYDSGKFPGRTPRAIENQLQRLGCFRYQKKKFFGTQITKAEIPDFNDVLARYVDAFNKLCEMTEYSKEDLERFRIIFMAAWKYRELFHAYEELEEVKHDVAQLKEALAQLLAEKKAEKRR
jgi:flagellar motility protein MotE (MotC chaperone)